MHGVPNFVESLILRDEQVALFVSCLLFEKWLNLTRAIEEVVGTILLLGLEIFDLLSLQVKIIDDARHLLFKTVNRLLVKNILKYRIALDPEVLGALGSKLCIEGGQVGVFVQVNSWHS